MRDESLFLRTLSEFARAMVNPYDVDRVLHDLAGRLTEILDLAGSGVTLAREARLEAVTGVPDRVLDLERTQLRNQSGPCVEAYRSGRVVAVPDLTAEAARWPEYAEVAARAGLTAVAGIPMRLQEESVGAVNLYAAGPRAWSTEDVGVAAVFADIATGYLVHASQLAQQQRLTGQLQDALDSRVVIEQAKGMLARAHGITVDEAFQRLRRHARSHQETLRSVADAVVHRGLVV